MRFLFGACVCISLLLSLTTELPSQEKKGESSSTQTYKGFSLTVLSIERTKELTQFGEVRRANGEREFAVIQIKVKLPKKAENFVIEATDLKLLDVTGNEHPFYAQTLGLYPGPGMTEIEAELPFIVPTGVQLQTLKIGSASFNLPEVTTQESEKATTEERR
jgi:hypothetical protein